MLRRLTMKDRAAALLVGAGGLLAAVLALVEMTGPALAALSLPLTVTALLVLEARVRSRPRDQRLDAYLRQDPSRGALLKQRDALLKEKDALLRQRDSLTKERDALLGGSRDRADELSEIGDRLVAGIAQERLASAERDGQLTEHLGRLVEDTSALSTQVRGLTQEVHGAWSTTDVRWDRFNTRLRRGLAELEGQLIAVAQLLRPMEVSAPLPGLGGWAAEASTVLHLRDLVQRHRPGLVVECGSGASTVWLAHTLRQTGGRIVSLEHDRAYAEQTRRRLVEHGLTDVAEVRFAPLRTTSVDGEEHQWYEPDALEGLEGISLLFVDGPPQAEGMHVRYPAMPLLGPRLLPGAFVVLDDGHRPGEQEILTRWTEENPQLEVVHGHDRAVTLRLSAGATGA